MSPFVALVFSAPTRLTCDLTINDHREVWHISADVDSYAYTAKSEDKVIKKSYAVMTVEYGFPNTLALSFDKRLLDIKMNGTRFCSRPTSRRTDNVSDADRHRRRSFSCPARPRFCVPQIEM
jgi:hypothetical protein